jgi:hypothetical protein
MVIDLTGGQPDLTPEWVPWMMQELRNRGLDHDTYLWSDDNLSNDYFWRYLSDEDINLIREYRNYGKVCCFKGYDRESFAFNTRAHEDLFASQFSLIERLKSLGLDLYCYATFTTANARDVKGRMAEFVDRLQAVDRNLPLRTVPLEIRSYGPTNLRMRSVPVAAYENQHLAVWAWCEELSRRFSEAELSAGITEVPLSDSA